MLMVNMPLEVMVLDTSDLHTLPPPTSRLGTLSLPSQKS